MDEKDDEIAGLSNTVSSNETVTNGSSDHAPASRGAVAAAASPSPLNGIDLRLVNTADGLDSAAAVVPDSCSESESAVTTEFPPTSLDFLDLWNTASKILIATNLPEEIFENSTLAKIQFENLFTAFQSDVHIIYFKSFHRARIGYESKITALNACLRADGTKIEENVIRVFFSQPVMPREGGSPTLRPPKPEKQFLISPPCSPPVGWEPALEAEPVIDYDFLAAISSLRPGEVHTLHPASESTPAIVVEPCESQREEDNMSPLARLSQMTKTPRRLPQTARPGANIDSTASHQVIQIRSVGMPPTYTRSDSDDSTGSSSSSQATAQPVPSPSQSRPQSRNPPTPSSTAYEQQIPQGIPNGHSPSHPHHSAHNTANESLDNFGAFSLASDAAISSHVNEINNFEAQSTGGTIFNSDGGVIPLVENIVNGHVVGPVLLTDSENPISNHAEEAAATENSSMVTSQTSQTEENGHDEGLTF